MYCLKCGGETPEQQLFCPDCLQSMEAYPVRPDTPIQLPKRQTTAPAKRSRQKEIPPEVEIIRIKTKLRRLRIGACLLLLAFALTLGALIYHLIQEGGMPTLTAGAATVYRQE